MVSRRKDSLAILFLFLLTLLVYGSALRPDQTFLPADLLLLTPPWKAHAQELLPGFHFVQRPAWDPLFYFYPARKFLADSLHAGHVPLWNPLILSGTPFAGDGQSAVWYPPNWLFAILPLASAFGWLAAAHTFLTGLFFYLYGRRVGWGRGACLAGASSWMLCGVLVVWQMWQVIDDALCWLPLALYFWEGWRQAQNRRQAVGMAIALALSLLAGHLQFAFYVWLTVAAYALCRPPMNRPRLWPLPGILALGAGMAAVQILATADLLGHTPRSGTPLRDILAAAMPPAQLVQILVPELFGGQRDWMQHPYFGVPGNGQYYELCAFCGAAALTLAGFGLRLRERGDLSRFWLGLAVFALLMGCGSPLYALFYYGVPLFKSFHGPARVFALFDFAVAALCAQGVQRLAQTAPATRRRLGGAVCGAVALLLLLGYRAAVTGAGPVMTQALSRDWLGYGLTQMGIAFGFAAGAGALLAFAPTRLSWLAAPLVAGEMLWFAIGVNGGVPTRLLYPSTPETRWVSSHLGDGRVLCLSDNNPAHAQSRLMPNSAMALGWPDVSGSDPLFLKNYAPFLAGLNQAQSGSPAPAGSTIVADAGSSALDRLSVRYIVSPRPLAGPSYKLALDGDVRVYENTGGLAGTRMVFQYRIVPDNAAAREELFATSPLLSPQSVLLNDGAGLPPGSFPISNVTLSRTSSGPGQTTIRSQADGAGVLVTDKIADPGWQASVDGRPVKTLVADTLFLAVPLTAGPHTVALHYEPIPVRLGLYLTCLAWGIAAALLLPKSAWKTRLK